MKLLKPSVSALNGCSERFAWSSLSERVSRFASLIKAKHLVLTHLSQRYKGDASLRSVLRTRQLEREAL